LYAEWYAVVAGAADVLGAAEVELMVAAESSL